MNRFQRLMLSLLGGNFMYEVRSTTIGGRNSFGTLLLMHRSYKVAKAKFDKTIKNSKPNKSVTIRLVSILNIGLTKLDNPNLPPGSVVTVTQLPDVQGDVTTKTDIPSTWTSEDSPAETAHPMAQALPYAAPDGYTGQDHMCDTAGGLVVIEPTGMMGPCCSVCGQPTD